MRILRYPWAGNLGDTLQSRVFEYYLRERYKDLKIGYVGRDFPIPVNGPDLENEFDNDTRDILLTGWLTQNPSRFLSLQRNLLGMIGVHIAAEGSLANGKLGMKHLFLSETFRNEFSGYNVSSRDLYTKNFFAKNGINAPFVGCVSTLISQVDLSRIPKQPESEILFVDVDPRIQNRLLENESLAKNNVTLTNKVNEIFGEVEKVRRVDLLIGSIISARIVFTSRLHVALPSMALGKPTVLIADEDKRFSGINNFLNIVSPKEVLDNPHSARIIDFAHAAPSSKISQMSGPVISHIDRLFELPPKERMQIKELDYEVQVLSEIASGLLQKLEESRNKLEESRNTEAAVLNSRSWRVTSPLRKTLKIVEGIRDSRILKKALN
jgi:hypothetical protein